MTGEGRLMKFWQNNRLDGIFEASIEQIVAQFRASTWWTPTSTSILLCAVS